MKNLKKRIQQGETVNGCWLNLGSSLTAEIVGSAGFDWLLIDLEHGAGNEKDVLSQLQALESSTAAALVRIESGEKQRIHRVLDLGVEGIMCPHIDTADEARAVVTGMRYPPHGSRGIARMVRASGYGKNLAEYSATANDTIVGIAQIESPEALKHVDEIAAVDGIDVLFIGPADLSISLGIFGKFDHPLFLDGVKKTIDAAQKAGKASGILLANPDDYTKYYNMGMRVIACGGDSTFVAEGARNMVAKLNAKRAQPINTVQ
jgi:4-hydroxy-2-oxoheptanedioate aldolase